MSTAGCFGKRAYPSRDAAHKAQKVLMHRRGFQSMVHAYHCDLCGGFHLGRDRKAGRPNRIRDDVKARLLRYYDLVSGEHGNG